MTTPDNPVPLCTAAQFTAGPLADLAKDMDTGTLSEFLIEGTRMCETETGRRLAPFTGLVETQAAQAIDPDEYSDSASLPMNIQDTLGMSYADAMGASNLVRRTWVDQYAPRLQDLWAYSNVSVKIIRSYGGTQALQTAQILNGPEPDTGHLWFQLGLYLPIGSRVQVTYSGGYTIAIPADLVRANRYVTAALIVSELNPDDSAHDPDMLQKKASKILANYSRS